LVLIRYNDQPSLNSRNEDLLVYPVYTANASALDSTNQIQGTKMALANNAMEPSRYGAGTSSALVLSESYLNITDLFHFDSPEFLFRSPEISDFKIKPASILRGGNTNVSTIFNLNGALEQSILTDFSQYVSYDAFIYKKWAKIGKYVPTVVGQPLFSYSTEGYSVLGRGKKTNFNSIGAAFTKAHVYSASGVNNPTVYNAAHWLMNKKSVDDDNAKFSSIGEKTMFISSPEAYAEYADLFSPTSAQTYGNAAPITNLYRELVEQYGGDTYEARQSNFYISTGQFIQVDYNSPVEIYGGDTYVTMFDHIKFMTNFGAYDTIDDYYVADVTGSDHLDAYKFGYAQVFPVETTINTDLRYATHFAVNGANGISANPINSVNADNYLYNGAYSEENDYKIFSGNEKDLVQQEDDVKVIGSEIKTNGELVDSWKVFKSTNQLDLEGSYGPINRIKILKDQLYAVQDRAFGLVQVNPQAAISGTGSGDGLIIGQGSVLNDHVYISTEYGAKHQWSVFNSDNSLYFFDALRKKMIMYKAGSGAAPLSDIKGLHGYFRTNIKGTILDIDHSDTFLLGDNPIENYGIHGTYDYKNQEAIMTFSTRDSIAPARVTTSTTAESFTIAFSEVLNAYSSFYSFTPSIYINDKKNILSPDPDKNQDIYIHDLGDYGVFYGNTPVESFVDIIVNQEPYASKTFNNIHFLSEVTDSAGDIYNETVDKVQVYNEYQDTGAITLTPEFNIKRRMRSWRLNIPRDSNARIRNPYTHIKLFYKNTLNRKLVLHDIITYYNSAPL
jgi:hypothetical protein